MNIRQMTPLGVKMICTMDQAIACLTHPISAAIDAKGNVLSVADVARDTGLWVKAFGQNISIPDHFGILLIINDEEVKTSWSGNWPENTRFSLVRFGVFPFQTGEVAFASQDGGMFGAQTCKVKLTGSAGIRNDIRALRRVLKAADLEAAFKADLVMFGEAIAAWFSSRTVEEIIEAQDNGVLPDSSALEPPEDHDWTFDFSEVRVQEVAYSKAVNDGLAVIKSKQQARMAALGALANGISKIQPGRPTAMKAMLDAIAVENKNGNITAEEAAAFAAQAREAEDKRLQDEAADKAAKAEGKLAAMIAVADDPEKFAALHTAIGDVVDTIGDQKALQLSGEAKVAFGTWFRAQIKGAQVPDDFNRLDGLVGEYAAYLAEDDAQQLPGMIEAEFILKKEAAERRQAQRLAAKTSGIQSGAEGLAAIIKNPPPDVLAIANALETNRALVAAAHLAQHTDQAERMVKAYTQGQLAGHNGAVPALPALGNIDALLGQAPSEQEQIDALLLQIRNEAPVAKTGKR